MNRYALAGAVKGVVFMLFFSAPAGAEGNQPLTTFLDTLNQGKEVSLTEADFISPAAVPVVPRPLASDTVKAHMTTPVPRKEAGVVPSRFKIQILAGPNQRQVKKERNRLSSKTDLPLSVTYEDPYYKLFAGDFSLYSEAESWCAQLKEMGYNDAWIVRTAASQGTR